MEFCTLGMFIIDDIYPAKDDKNQEPRLNVIGGAGTYSAIGARLFCPPPESEKVGWIVDAGTDFPTDVKNTITSWQTGLLLRPRDGLTTRGWNGYGENDFRSFKYLTEKIRITADDLTPEMLASKSFHLICSATRCVELVERIMHQRGSQSAPIFIWEPVPDLIVSSELENIKKALRCVTVCSPNHDELAALFDYKHTDLDTTVIQTQAQRLLEYGVGGDGTGAVVVRCGKQGCLVKTTSNSTWVPAYHQDQSKVIDPTGGGNGFLGGFAMALARGYTLDEAAIHGSVAASYCIEQVGPPQLHADEKWNNTSVSERLAEFLATIS